MSFLDFLLTVFYSSSMRNNKRLRNRVLLSLAIFLIIFNLLAAMHAYKFTHFTTTPVPAKTLTGLTFKDKAVSLITGSSMARPENDRLPDTPFTTLSLQSNLKLQAWSIPVQNPRGIIAVFHGYARPKSFMLDKSKFFNSLGYSTFLTDFMGSGGSEGNHTTVGYREAEEVKTVYEHLQKQKVRPLILYGTSMGAVAIMKAVSQYDLKPDAIIIECPFGSMYETACARFRILKAPSFPAAGILLFWGSVESGFWTFSHKPTVYAKNIQCPTFLIYGAHDPKVTYQETKTIYNNLPCPKKLFILPNSGHDDYLETSPQEWKKVLKEYLQNVKSVSPMSGRT